MRREFNIIERYFAPLSGPEGLSLKDDAACVSVPSGYDLVVTKDMLVAGKHFFHDDHPTDIATKALAVNLSDLAAKGADPKYYWLAIAIPRNIDDDWVAAFAAALGDMQRAYGFTLAGGDTVSTDGPLSISITIVGHVEQDTMIKRSGACVGDDIYVSGTLGDAAFGLIMAQGGMPSDDYCLGRLRRPVPRVALGEALRKTGAVTASADVSDGLLADLGHICKASDVAAELAEDDLPLSESVQALDLKTQTARSRIWAGGDDYEIVFTASVSKQESVMSAANVAGVKVTRIGKVVGSAAQDTTVRLFDKNQQLVKTDLTGFSHFNDS